VVKNLQISSINKNIDKNLFHRLVSLLKKELNFELAALQLNFISSDYIHKINKKYLQHDYSTDIITFNYTENKLLLDGELYISIQDTEKNAKKYGISLEQELLRLVIHGVLHLLGYDDMSKDNKIVMKKIENRLVNKYNFLILKNQA
jgi:rRNA maturation RNase YbeY